MTAEKRVRWYEQMLEIRLFEEKVQELFMDGLIEGTTHLCQGQEAVPVGAVSALRDDDYMTITYRGHGHALARGISIEACFAELMGRATGCCKGVGGSMHFTDVSKGLLGAFAIVGAGLPVAVGAAHSARLQGRDSVALTFFGDGATNIGTFHEALNLASAWKAPTIFIIENNLYGEYTPMRETTPIDDLADRAKGYAIPGIIVDGQDIDAVHSATSEAIARARSGEGPSLLEMKKSRDPLAILGARLADEGLLSEADQETLRETVQQMIDETAGRAQAAPFPTLEETRNYVYAV
jgi:TPP-dependent pyruvate/acetoin dehydrogenase alpha subunit